MPSFQSFVRISTPEYLFFDLKDKNYKKEKMKGGLGWMKNIGNDPRSLFNGNHFSTVIVNTSHELYAVSRAPFLTVCLLPSQNLKARSTFL